MYLHGEEHGATASEVGLHEEEEELGNFRFIIRCPPILPHSEFKFRVTKEMGQAK